MQGGVRLLGVPSIREGGQWRDVPLDKRLALLTYLACSEDWVSRERLSYLFWPDTSTSQARSNLRQLLARTRALPFHLVLEADDKRLRWDVESDVKAFRQAVAAADWRSALEQYRGELAAGLETDDGSEFANWLEFERAQLGEAHRQAALRRADESLAAGRPEEAATIYDALLLEDPLDESVLQSLLRLLVQLGAVEEARRRLRAFTARLKDELGLAPAAATERLVSEAAARQAAADTQLAPVAEGGARPARLSAPLTSFVGRDAELDQAAARLTSEACRLLTVLGPGGVGKTRLALAAAERLASRFQHGYVAVPLGSVATPAALPLALAAALGLELRGLRPPLEQLSDHLKPRELLLLLDNFEHLADAALQVQELLGSCPRLKVLVTSRQRLRLQAEWLLPLAGLATPPQPATPEVSEEQLADAMRFGALRLLEERASQVEPGFAITTETLPTALGICLLLEGLPLGIELAAGWLRQLSLREVRAALESSLDALPSDALDASERHRSLRVAIDHSWDLLSEAERAAFRALAVFHGGFDRAGARGVAGVSTPLLGALSEKSLLRQVAGGRYDRHPLIHRYMRERLDELPEEARRLRDAHARYYVKLLASWSGRLHGPQQRLMLAQLTPDYNNLTAAWLTALERGWVTECLAGQEPLVLFHGVQGRFTEGERLFATSLAQLDPHAGQAQGEVLRAALTVDRAWFLAALGRFDEAVDGARSALQLVAGEGAPWVEVRALQVLGSVASRRGDDAAARELLEQSLALAEATGDRWGIGLVSGQLGLHELRGGHHARAKALFERSLEVNEALGNAPGIVNDLDYLGRLSLEAGDVATAAGHFERGLALAERSRFALRVPYLLTQLAEVKQALGRPAAATADARRALEVAEALGQRALQAEALTILGRLGASPAERSGHLRRALALARDLEEVPRTLEVLLELARLPGQWLPPALPAGTLLRLVAAHPAARPAQRQRALALLGHGAASSDAPAGDGALQQPDDAPLPSLGEVVRLLL